MDVLGDATVTTINVDTILPNTSDILKLHTGPTTQTIEVRTSQMYPLTNNATIFGGANNRWSAGHFGELDIYSDVSTYYTKCYSERWDNNTILRRRFFGNWTGGNYHQLYFYNYNRIDLQCLTSTSGTNRGVFLSGNAIKLGAPLIEYTGQFVQVSDDRLKNNEASIPNVYDKINNINIQRYTKYTFDQKTGERTGEGCEEYGVIAQSLLNTDLSWCVVKIYKGVDDNTDDPSKFYYSVAYQNLFSLNIEATKQLINQVKTQQDKISSLEARILALEGK